MLRVAVPYGELSSAQVRVLAKIAREYDQPATVNQGCGGRAEQRDIQLCGLRTSSRRRLRPLHHAPERAVQLDSAGPRADVMDLLASVNMHGIQTSGNCIRNITSDALAGIAPDEVADPRPFAEMLRQWSTLHPEFAFLPRKFKIAITGAREDRAAIAWHDIGLRCCAMWTGALGFRGARGRRHGPHAHHRHRDPHLCALEPDPELPRSHRARLQPLWPPRQQVQGAHQDPGQGRRPALHRRGGSRVPARSWSTTVRRTPSPQAEFDRVSACFVPPALQLRPQERRRQDCPGSSPAAAEDDWSSSRWLQRNVQPHQQPRAARRHAVVQAPGPAPGDATADQLDAPPSWPSASRAAKCA
jgi:sulfite reductase (NADPH) hemoprotein beta-component